MEEFIGLRKSAMENSIVLKPILFSNFVINVKLMFVQ